ncbi:MAG: cytochrome c [Saprospiraceae bacterium]|uniref:Cytochrome c n=1 Tax=Candidatus Opimibacter skivensis TaxID=2982028 RepID=A0A9D7SZT5_9BACT|nr:cytochrome c [Candidatus Opimibacter skivensis]
MKSNKNIYVGLCLILFSGLHFDLTAQAKTTTKATSRYGDSPLWADTIRNPLASVSGSAAAGKTTYMKLCTVCHGNFGKGDGIAAASLAVKPADHTGDRVQKQTDGSLYYELTNGHAPMPAYKADLTDKQRWQLICYIRTLKAVPKKP